MHVASDKNEWVSVPCPLCGGTDRESVRTIRCELFGTDATAELARCTRCGLIRTDPQPRGETLAGFYATDAYYTHARDGNALKRAMRRWQLSGPLAVVRLWAEEHTDLSRYAKRFAPRRVRPIPRTVTGLRLWRRTGCRHVRRHRDACHRRRTRREDRKIAATRGVEVYPTLDQCPPGEFDRIVLPMFSNTSKRRSRLCGSWQRGSGATAAACSLASRMRRRARLQSLKTVGSGGTSHGICGTSRPTLW